MDGGVRRLDAELQRVDARLGEELLPDRAGRAVATEGVDMPSTGLRRGASRSLLLPREVGGVALQVRFGCNCHCSSEYWGSVPSFRGVVGMRSCRRACPGAAGCVRCRTACGTSRGSRRSSTARRGTWRSAWRSASARPRRRCSAYVVWLFVWLLRGRTNGKERLRSRSHADPPS